MRFFFCYSPRLKRALVSNGFIPIKYGLNHVSGSHYWLFEGTAELNEYKNNKYPNEREKF